LKYDLTALIFWLLFDQAKSDIKGDIRCYSDG